MSGNARSSFALGALEHRTERPPRLRLSSHDLEASIHFLKEADNGATRRAVAEEQVGGVSFPGVSPPDESRNVDALRDLDEDDSRRVIPEYGIGGLFHPCLSGNCPYLQVFYAIRGLARSCVPSSPTWSKAGRRWTARWLPVAGLEY